MSLAVIDCGYVPRCALEATDSSEVRIQKIFRLIEVCQFGIHDISRTELDEEHQLPRFNMPLELGIYLGAKRYGGEVQEDKLCLILDRQKYRYQKYCSDIAGQDIRAHNGEPLQAIKRVRDWLSDATPEIRMPGGKTIGKRYLAFREDFPVLCEALRLDPEELTFNDLTSVVDEWLRLTLGAGDGSQPG